MSIGWDLVRKEPASVRPIGDLASSIENDRQPEIKSWNRVSTRQLFTNYGFDVASPRYILAQTPCYCLLFIWQKDLARFFLSFRWLFALKSVWFNRPVEYFPCRFTITKETPILWPPSIFYEYINVHNTYICVRICTRTKLFVIYKYLIATISIRSRTEFTHVASIFPLLFFKYAAIFKICRHQSRLTYAHISMEIEGKVNETKYRSNVIE